jgi:signal transduction histidine kinase
MRGSLAAERSHSDASHAVGDGPRGDDGYGFNPAASTETRGFGLISMRERAARIGATVTVDSARGRGTVVAVDLSTSFRPSTGPP